MIERVPKNREENRYAYNFTKRIIDIVGTLVGSIVLLPIMFIVAVLIKIDSKGPVLFSQTRVGKDGKLFKMYKFRSMISNAEELKKDLLSKNEMSGPMFKIAEDPRVTKIGKFIRRTSIDELPQLWNVLKGEMSLVGPRPNLPEEVRVFSEWQRQKLIVKPGLTCYWQVLGRNQIGFEEWMRLDVKYIQDRNIFLDFKLILKTIVLLFGDKHAH